MFSPIAALSLFGGEVCRLTLQVAEIVAHQLQVGHRVIDAGIGINIQGTALSGRHAGQWLRGA
ncbi:Uncharacterised protein [Leclercia adecarboxylata]|uniref:Uncharacterized protein n=1 Tax=Leclercia adecarboxylata TaxID=83655 RepID=A0A4U9HQ69_9ENTR|nr:Uncharacterised protein [Leclercia adecarboxylata]